MNKNVTLNKRIARHKRVLGKIGLSSMDKKRVLINKTNTYLYAHVIDDLNKKILKSFDTRKMSKNTKIDQAKELASVVSEYLKSNNIDKIVFDRNGYKYHGVLVALADGMRSNGIVF